MQFCKDQNKIKEFIEDILAQRESEDLEYKCASGGFPGSFWDTYSAFANTEGGTIVFGVMEKSDGFYLDNLSDEVVEKYRKEFWNNVNNKSTISCNLLKNDDVEIVKFNGYNLMLFHIPCASHEQRPVFRTTNPYNGTFKRNYEGDYKCTEKEVRRMFADANDSTPADSRILPNYSLDDFDKESLQQYRQLFAVARPIHPWLGLDDKSLLEKLGGYRKDRETGKEGFTLAGLLMFGKYDAITDNACSPNFFPDYQEWLNDDPNARWSSRIYPDGTWEANLLVKHAKNMFVFSNPGTMLITKAQYYKGGQSVCRNKSLQKMFMMLGAAEKAGSGLPLVSLLDDEVKKELTSLFGKDVVRIEHNWLLTLALAYTEGCVTNERLRYALNLHKADIAVLLKEMCNKGYLSAEGHGRGMKYYLPQDDNLGSNLGSNLRSSPISKTRKKRMSRNEIRAEITNVCSDWVSLDYIAASIERNPDYLLSDVIPLMLEEGLIERMYPDSPRSPYQKYKKKE